MEVQFGPSPIDEPNLLYKLQCKIKVFATADALAHQGYNLVGSSSKYGLVFIGVPDGTLSVYNLHQLISNESEPLHMTVNLPEKPTHVSVSCDYELLAVTGTNMLCIYKVVDFQNPKVAPILSLKYELSSPSYVTAMQWNPCIPDSIALAFHNGTLITCQVGAGQVKKVASKARCICWSPKGKQLVTGNSDGTLHQFKPDLTPAKAFPAPNLFEGAPVEALAVYWISTYQFAVVYKNASENSRPSVTIVNTPKGGQSTCLNYEDICYSMGNNRPWYYYLHGIAQWNIIMSASSNSMEMATIGSTDGLNWLQWCQPDEARPELPLTDKKQENYPLGLCLDPCAIHQLPWGENEKLPFMPLLHVLSHTGMLTIFNVINLNNQMPQICCPPQLLTLPAEAMESGIPGEAPKQTETPTPVPVAKDDLPLPPPQTANHFNPPPAAPIKVPSFTPAPSETKPSAKNEPAPPPFQDEKPPPKAPSQPPQEPPENAALKAEQDRINKAKVNQELKNMLVKEVNDFQTDLYNFMLKTRETQARIQRDIESINSNFSFNTIDTEQLKKECSIDELRNAVVQLKLELVRACAVIAEARTHSDAREFHKWSQADPLTTKRVASIEKLAYYVHTQLDQAQEALDYKWSKASRDLESDGPGKRMIRPILDDVYQPLVKQQEILSRQQAVLRTLRKTLSECDLGPVFKSTSLLRSTPFKNKDPLSKLTKNILNMSIEPQNSKPKGLFTVQKLEVLKDILANRKTVKIKPVTVEFRQHLVTMKENYERLVKEKMSKAQEMAEMDKTSGTNHASVIPEYKKEAPLYQPMKSAPVEQKPSQDEILASQVNYKIKLESAAQKTDKSKEVKNSVSAPSFTPKFAAVPNVARTLFTDEPEQDLPKAPQQVQQQAKPSSFTQQPTITTSSVLKDLLQSKSQANLAGMMANDANNIFMGQKICSPNNINRSSKPTSAMPSSEVPIATPISNMSNMFSKLPTQAEATSKPPQTSNTVPSFEKPTPTFPQPANVYSETGEPDLTSPDFKPTKPMTNLFGMKASATSTPVPDVLKSLVNQDKISIKLVDRTEKSKENVPKSDDAKEQKTEKKDGGPLGAQTANKGFSPGLSANKSSPFGESKASDSKSKGKTNENTEANKTSEPRSNSAAAAPKQTTFPTPPSLIPKETKPKESASPKETKPPKESASAKEPSIPKDTAQPKDSTPKESTESTPKESTPKSEPKQPAESKSPASSIFGAAVASQPKTDGLFASQSSIFSTTNTPPVFGSKTPFGAGSMTFGQAFTGQTTTASVFSSPSEPAISPNSTPEVTPISLTTESDTETVPTSVAVSTPSIFGGTTAVTTATSSSVFTTTASSVFGQATAAFAPTSTSLFTATTASTFGGSVFGTTTQASVFDTTSTPSAVFGTAASQAFGSKTPITTQPGSIFGTPTTQAPIFGTAAPTALFGGTQTTQASVFGTPTPATQASVFGTPTPTTQASVFGTPTQTTQASVFGTPTQTTQASIFGTPTQTTQASIFGTPTQTTQASVFGTPTQSTQASIFGTQTQTTQASIFGTPTQTTQASVFGGTQTSQTSVFGAPGGGSLFGSGEANLFASASISTTNAPTGTTGNIFGGNSTGSVFGSGNVFGKTAFGQTNNNAAASIFGGANTFGQQKPANSIWAGASNTSGFGSTGFGQQTTQASSIFGGAGGSSFTAPSSGAFGSAQQTPAFGTGESQPSSVFGSPQQAPAFGGSPAFGAKPAFGQSAGFGSPTGGGFGAFGGGFNKSPSGFGAPATFGTAATFGGTAFGNTSPGKVFGGSAPTGFGSPTQQSNATFENLATQNTLTFGSLAQSPQQQPQQPSFNTSPSFTGWRG